MTSVIITIAYPAQRTTILFVTGTEELRGVRMYSKPTVSIFTFFGI